MVSFTHLLIASSTVLGIFAAPAIDKVERDSAAESLPDFEIGGANLARRQDYTQNYKTGGNVNFQSTNNGYSVTFSGAQDFVVGRGWKTGTSRNITFSGTTTASSGTVLLSVYGWSTNPLVEYYIQEYSNSNGAAQGTKIGTLESDGSTYDIWKHQQVNQPSISGTTTFWQYISVRQQKRTTGGTITTANHFAAWAKQGMKLGAMNYQVLATEGWGSADNDIK
ncbi:putative endo-1,4-beta-xylanase 1 [Glarea lozoyensis 74030]|uniref:Endo-1,4-beta-xylanase n=1 Tax=Glarea lozoyensis (strain ATCC 74030 / MF5533) TaxID=1104152 RepID=H0EXY5_GLAL7|nr:putative endo-1,4-beta-xylanase 1 [Glarea lozoyensis 74030]